MEYFGNAFGVFGLTFFMLVLVWPQKLPDIRHREEPSLGDYKSITARD